jgi:hypothetical protein
LLSEKVLCRRFRESRFSVEIHCSVDTVEEEQQRAAVE